jgi:serine-type D-Ala-D-Ala carboxypeptidase (penicillin-binding protein 5/6)
VLLLRRAAAAGALACAAAILLTGGAAAAATPRAAATVAGTDVVGGPDLAAPGIVVHRLAGSTPLPAVQADSWLLADLTTGDVLAAKAPHRRSLPASMLKTLTAVTLMPKLDKTTVITATDAEVRADGGHVGIVAGATYTLWDLWHGLLLPSANDAAAAIADANGGMATTVAQMQAMAVHLQALDTSVRNDSGLDDPRQLSSPYDMALFAKAAMQIPDFVTVTQSVNYDFPGRPSASGGKRQTYKIYSQNRLLLHGYKGTVGGKTGFTSLAHRTFWGAAQRGGHTLLVVLFQIKDPTEKASRALLDWGFANVGKVTPVGHLVDPVSDAAPSAAPSASAAAAGGSGETSATASQPTSSGFRVSKTMLAVVGGLLVLAGAALLLWRRRRSPPASAEPLPGGVIAGGAADGPAGPVAPTGAARPTASRPAAQRSSSVVVTTPGGGPRVAAAPAPAPPGPGDDGTVVGGLATGVASASVGSGVGDDTGPQPIIASTPASGGTATSPAPEPHDTLFDQNALDPLSDEPAPTTVAANGTSTTPPQGGHVRVIRPPSRPS